MPRLGGYTTLPDSSNEDASSSGGTGTGDVTAGDGSPSTTTGRSGYAAIVDPQEAARALAAVGDGDRTAAADGSLESPSAETIGGKNPTATAAIDADPPESEAKPVDLTGGLPTAQGMVVGSPVSQHTPFPLTPMTAGGIAGGQQRATVVTAAPLESYNRVVSGVDARSGYQVRSTGRGAEIAGQPTVIVVNSPAPHEWGRGPQPFMCGACGFSGYSNAMLVRYALLHNSE